MKGSLENGCNVVMSYVFASAVALCALFVVSCGSMPGEAVGSSGRSAAVSTPLQQQATGSGHIVIGDAHRTFSFGAVRHSDGLVSGNAQLFNRATGFESHAEIICMTVIGNHAWMGGIINHSDVRECEDSNMFFHVQDNGEGRERRTDLLSGAGVCDEWGPAAVALVLAYCDSAGAIAPYDLPMFPIEDGNIQVQE